MQAFQQRCNAEFSNARAEQTRASERAGVVELRASTLEAAHEAMRGELEGRRRATERLTKALYALDADACKMDSFEAGQAAHQAALGTLAR